MGASADAPIFYKFSHGFCSKIINGINLRTSEPYYFTSISNVLAGSPSLLTRLAVVKGCHP